MRKPKHFKVMGFLMFQGKQKPIIFPRHGENEFPKNRETNENHKHDEVMAWLNVSGKTDIHTFPETCQKA